MFDLLDFAENNAKRIRNGTGSFHYQVRAGNRTVTLFTCSASGYVSVSLMNFRPPVWVPNRILGTLRDRVQKIIGERAGEYPDRPGFEVQQTVVDPKIMRNFQDAILRFQHDIDAI